MTPHDIARGFGRLEAEGDEIERLLEIFLDPIARARPRAAWMMLPRGADATETLVTLKHYPEETSVDRHDFWTEYANLLVARKRDFDRNFSTFMEQHNDRILN